MVLNFKFFVIYFLIRYTRSDYEPAYFKICSKEFKQSIESTECEKGIWLKQPTELGCACIRGVWALSNGFCDDKAVILVGDGHCYHIPFEVRSAKLIGDPNDPFKPKVYVTPSSLDGIYEIREGNYTPTLLSDSTMIIGVNPRQVAQRKDFGLCLDLEPRDYGKPVHVFSNARRVSKEWTLNPKREYMCSTLSMYHHHIAFGELFSIEKNKIEPRKLVERRCRHECPGEEIAVNIRSMRGLGRAMGNETETATETVANSTSQISQGVNVNRRGSTVGDQQLYLNQLARRRPSKNMAERQTEREQMRANAAQEADYYQKEVNEQTLRMMHAHVSPLLLNVPGPQVVTREYSYFQHVRLVVEKACPEEYVPKNLVRGLMRMFRQLLWETQDTFEHLQSADDAQFNRTLSRLTECANKTKDETFTFVQYNETYAHSVDREYMMKPLPERCPVPLIYAINGSVYDRSGYSENVTQFLRNFTYMFPTHLKYNSSQVDFVIEAAWKITMIGHYRCSKYFDDETATDFSHFFHQVQSFFNPRIIKRWYYEKSIKATEDIVRMIFSSFDLNKFMFGLDTCLVGTQGFSHFDFTTIWLQRPKIPYSENDLRSAKHVLPGSGSFLSTMDYAPDATTTQSPNAKKQATTTAPVKVTPKSRGKRDVNGGYSLWDNNARCINEYMEPVMRMGYGYRLPTDCVTPVDPSFVNIYI